MAGSRWRKLAALALLSLLAACVRVIPETGGPTRPTPAPTPAPTPVAESAVALGVEVGPPVSSLELRQEDAAAALLSFHESCPKLTVRTDASGLTSPGDWRAACAAFATWPYAKAAQFFATYFETLRVGDGKAFATGYYEPEIAGSRAHLPGFDVPVYGLPDDLVRAAPGDAAPLANGTMPLGRYDETGKFVPYYDRTEIENGALAGRGLEIAWAADPVEFFFLQVQGSGMLRAPDGQIMRIGYAGQNGQTYTGIGGVMRERGLIGEGPGQYSGSMQGIMQYLREHPDEGRALMRENRSWVFFRELTTDGPLGALEVPVRAESSVAADPRFVPLGAPVWLELDRREANGLWIAQDTGGAIKGANRFDTFWGAGETARRVAGGMSGRGRALILVPKGTATRLGLK
ncbi:murein transglycosylase A [Novosphingobium album (ex Liu et al. 2023)]|uniref:peptidoglycan lytic exotransglycosylase n=1 Tax=Novosphingobium album (ex Liu et al. 2023) TaxID=3031130 RepID=A0ABT5WVP1_9SPHN|nr:murein transglycosylase A [Novosphingobium album (ex Liu et al. 2023)]MDE8653985.1 murein transglycosylase A [Novosphingobium album (ex Liu et al. 2023)]